jgi:small ligand-binding sensory domain FIST
MTMSCASALSTASDSDAAIQDVVDRVAGGLREHPADLAVAFVSAHHAEALGRLADAVRGRGLARHIMGCTGESIVGEDREVEGKPAVSLWAIRLPGVELRTLRLTFDGEEFQGWPNDLGADATPGRSVLLLGDPFSFPADGLLKRLNAEAPGVRVVGGMASAAQAPGRNRLVLDDQIVADGAVGVVLDGSVRIRTVVSQGCRPIGRPMIVTRAENNLIRELGRRPALEVLRETFEALPEDDQERVRQGLHIGRVINEYQESFHRGDFLVRNVMGTDSQGGLAITDLVRVGQTVQFHVRDADSADEDLRSLLQDTGQEPAGARPAGALLFSCNGRGTRLFPDPDHDVSALRDALGPIPVAGFFAMGEIGPVGGQNFLHGFTASIALFEGDEAGRG